MARARKKDGQPVITAMERKFITAYTTGSLNALEAARAAGYKSAAKESFNLLRRPHILAEIKRRQYLLRRNEDFNLGRLLNWSAFAATFDIGEIFKPGTFKILPLSKWPNQRLRRLVERVKVTEKDNGDIVTEVSFIPRNPNFDRVAALMGVQKRVPQMAEDGTRSIPISVLDQLLAAAEEAEAEAAEAQQAQTNVSPLRIEQVVRDPEPASRASSGEVKS